MCDAGIEVELGLNHLIVWRRRGILCQTTIPPPMIGYGAATVRDDEADRGEIPEEIGCDELHECGGIRVNVVGAGSMEIGITGGADVNHCWHVELDHFLVERIPMLVGQRWGIPIASRWIRIQIAANKTQLLDASFTF